MRRIEQRPAARRDLIEHFAHLAEVAGIEVAERFLERARISFQLLAEQPVIGAPLPLLRPELAGLRKWRVKTFDNYLIFYLPKDESVHIVRVLHAASDWWGLFGWDTAAHD